MRDARTLGRRVLELRKAKGLSQRQLAGPEISPSYISLIESGRRWPTLDVIELLAQRLHTTSGALIEGVEVPAPNFDRRELDLRWSKIALRAGNPASAEKYARLVLDEEACTPRQRVEGLTVLAGAAELQGRLADAIEILEPLVDELDRDGARESWRACQVMLCRCYKDIGDLGHAIELGEKALSFMDEMSDDEVLLAVSLADAYFLRGDVHRAGRLLSQILTRSEVVGSHSNQGAALWNLSRVAEAEGRIDDAVRLSERAMALFSESDAVRNLGRLRVTYAFMLREGSVSSVPLARSQLRRAGEDFELEGTVLEKARCLTELARCALDEGDVADAEKLIEQATTVVEDGPVLERANVQLVRGHALVRAGETSEGLHLATAAAELLEEGGGTAREAARAWREVAGLAGTAGDPDLALRALERAIALLGVRAPRVGPDQPNQDAPATLSSSRSRPTRR